jgi:hypothetical protein
VLLSQDEARLPLVPALARTLGVYRISHEDLKDFLAACAVRATTREEVPLKHLTRP